MINSFQRFGGSEASEWTTTWQEQNDHALIRQGAVLLGSSESEAIINESVGIVGVL